MARLMTAVSAGGNSFDLMSRFRASALAVSMYSKNGRPEREDAGRTRLVGFFFLPITSSNSAIAFIFLTFPGGVKTILDKICPKVNMGLDGYIPVV